MCIADFPLKDKLDRSVWASCQVIWGIRLVISLTFLFTMCKETRAITLEFPNISESKLVCENYYPEDKIKEQFSRIVMNKISYQDAIIYITKYLVDECEIQGDFDVILREEMFRGSLLSVTPRDIDSKISGRGSVLQIDMRERLIDYRLISGLLEENLHYVRTKILIQYDERDMIPGEAQSVSDREIDVMVCVSEVHMPFKGIGQNAAHIIKEIFYGSKAEETDYDNYCNFKITFLKILSEDKFISYCVNFSPLDGSRDYGGSINCATVELGSDETTVNIVHGERFSVDKSKIKKYALDSVVNRRAIFLGDGGVYCEHAIYPGGIMEIMLENVDHSHYMSDSIIYSRNYAVVIFDYKPSYAEFPTCFVRVDYDMVR